MQTPGRTPNGCWSGRASGGHGLRVAYRKDVSARKGRHGMTRQKNEAAYWIELRRRAERLVNQSATPGELRNGHEVNRLIHEIHVIQAELELQNEEISSSRYAAESAQENFERLYRKYASLFDFAPNGYLTFDRNGEILELNLAAAVAFNAPRNSLIGRRITDYIHQDDRDGFDYQIHKCHKNRAIVSFESKMKRADGFLFNAQLQMQSLSTHDGDDALHIMALVDVSEHAHLSASIALQQECLEISIRATDMQTLLDGYVGTIKSYLQCDAVGIRIRDNAGNIPYQAYVGFSQEFYDSESPLALHTDQCMCIAVIKGDTKPGKPYCTSNGSFYINGTSRLLATVPAANLGKTRNVCNAHGYESVVLVPIVIDNTIEGLIHAADCRENRFPVRMVESLEEAAMRLGLSIKRFDLQEKLEDSLGALKDLSSHLMTVQEDEQQRIAMELHDGCGQDLNALKLHLKALQNEIPAAMTVWHKNCDRLRAFTDKIINDIRNISHNLKPAALETLGLTVATRQMVREFSATTRIQVEMNINSLARIQDAVTQVCLFRIIQEALMNIHKHAKATWALIAADRDGPNICIRIQDNGIGFNPLELSRKDLNICRGMGLSAMKLRCRMINADLSIKSEAGIGTCLSICLPCPRPKAKR
jgi:PAS domain S-box-containing protein